MPRWLATLPLLVLPLFAQQHARLTGVITDPSGRAVAEAAVSVISEDTGFRRVSSTFDNGSYSVSSLQPGLYKIFVRKPGFPTLVRMGVKLDVAQWRPELAGALQALRKPDAESELPPGFEPRARRLYARACVLDRVLTLAGQAGTGGAVNSTEMRLREDALRPLAAACRTAIVAACNSPISS